MARQPIHRNPITPSEHPVRLPKRSAPTRASIPPRKAPAEHPVDLPTRKAASQHPVGHPALAARVKAICTLAMRD